MASFFAATYVLETQTESGWYFHLVFLPSFFFRNMAYKDPKKRQMWLKIWFNTLEEAEELNQDAFELDEEGEEAGDGDGDQEDHHFISTSFNNDDHGNQPNKRQK